MKSTIVKIL